MSTPPNPLDKFRSHSFHHILVCSNNTESLRKMMNDNFLGTVSGAVLGEEILDGVFLVVDTRKTSEFMIDHLQFKTMLGGTSSPSAQALPMGALSMRIIDPSGIGLFNYLKYLVDQRLQTDTSGIFFMLHTMFIGHTDSGKTEVVETASMPLILGPTFTLSEFSSRGGIYDLQFMPISLTMGDSFEAYCNTWGGAAVTGRGVGGILGTSIQALENQLNLASKRYYEISNPIDRKFDEEVNDPQVKQKNASTKKKGKLVQYMITIPDTWFYFNVATPGDKNGFETNWKQVLQEKTTEANQQNQQQQTKVTNGKEPATYVAASVNMTIPDAIYALLTACPDVNKLMSRENKEAGTGKIFKTFTSITADDDFVLVYFDIVEFELPDINNKKDKVQETTNNTSSGPKRDDTNVPNSWIFDYVFSGKNEDILDFKITVNNLQLALYSSMQIAQKAANDIKNSGQNKKDVTQQPQLPTNTFIQNLRENQPAVMPAASTETQLTNAAAMPNKLDPNSEKMVSDRQEFHKTLSDLVTAMGANTVKIRGNPDIYKSFSVNSIAPHVKLTADMKKYISTDINTAIDKLSQWTYNVNTKSTPTAGQGATIAQAHIEHRKFIDTIVGKAIKDAKEAEKKPSFGGGTFMKVNIFAPSDYPFSNAKNHGNMYNGYREQFFYDGWYLAPEVTSTFEGSNFTQDIALKTYDVYGTLGFGTADETSQPKSNSQSVQDTTSKQ